MCVHLRAVGRDLSLLNSDGESENGPKVQVPPLMLWSIINPNIISAALFPSTHL